MKLSENAKEDLQRLEEFAMCVYSRCRYESQEVRETLEEIIDNLKGLRDCEENE